MKWYIKKHIVNFYAYQYVKKSYINMFIFLTLIFSTIAGNRINSFSIPFALEAGLDADKSSRSTVWASYRL